MWKFDIYGNELRSLINRLTPTTCIFGVIIFRFDALEIAIDTRSAEIIVTRGKKLIAISPFATTRQGVYINVVYFVNVHQSICELLDKVFPQPIAEEITPHICVLRQLAEALVAQSLAKF